MTQVSSLRLSSWDFWTIISLSANFTFWICVYNSSIYFLFQIGC